MVLEVDAELNPRVKYSINENWRFVREDVANVLQPEFDDSSWQMVSFPHTWNGSDVKDDVPGYYRDIAWYRRTLNISAEYNGKQVAVFFEGANKEVELCVNGKSAGAHVGGYTRFSFDITNFVRFGEQNIFSVKVNNRFNENIPPLSADFTFFGGIYRDVYLVYTNKLHISTTHYATGGVYFELQPSTKMKLWLR